MIARIWSARTTLENWPAYEHHFTKNVVAELREISGYAGAKLLKHEVEARVELTVITFWQSWEAIDAFAGPERKTAVVAPSAAALLIDYDRSVKHYEVAASYTAVSDD
jgi:heme-degrading monooxygenase HmoA